MMRAWGGVKESREEGRGGAGRMRRRAKVRARARARAACEVAPRGGAAQIRRRRGVLSRSVEQRSEGVPGARVVARRHGLRRAQGARSDLAVRRGAGTCADAAARRRGTTAPTHRARGTHRAGVGPGHDGAAGGPRRPRSIVEGRCGTVGEWIAETAMMTARFRNLATSRDCRASAPTPRSERRRGRRRVARAGEPGGTT